jgi:hypothetical protein
MLRTTHPMTQYHAPEDVNPQIKLVFLSATHTKHSNRSSRGFHWRSSNLVLKLTQTTIFKTSGSIIVGVTIQMKPQLKCIMFIILKQQKIPVLRLQTSTCVSFLMRAPVIYFQTIHFNCVDFCVCCFTYAKPSLSTDFSPLHPWTQNKTVTWSCYMGTHIILGWINFQKPVLVVLHISMHDNWDLQCCSMSVCQFMGFLVLSTVWCAPRLIGACSNWESFCFSFLFWELDWCSNWNLYMCNTQETCQNCNRSKGHPRTCLCRHRRNIEL